MIALGSAAIIGALMARGGIEAQQQAEASQQRLGIVAIRTSGSADQAEIRIDGVAHGSTPIEIELPVGTISVLCTFRQRKTTRLLSIDVLSGRRQHVLCTSGHADLRIAGPRGWQISIDGKPPIALPVSLIRTMDGTYTLEWSRPGRKKKVRRNLRLKPNENRTVRHWKEVK